MIRGIKFIGIPVRDQDIALKFYTETLEFKIITDQPFTPAQRWIELMIPGAETGLALFTPEGHEDRIGQFHSISFWCEDVFATAKVLKAKGATLSQEPKTESWGFADRRGVSGGREGDAHGVHAETEDGVASLTPVLVPVEAIHHRRRRAY